jgi:hypothetical protein
MSANSKTILYGLECSHAAPGPNTLVSGVLRCAWCMEQKVIVGIIEYEWHAVCQNCAFSRWAGLSKHNADIFAAGHSRKNAAHFVVREYARNPEAVKTARKFTEWTGRKTA